MKLSEVIPGLVYLTKVSGQLVRVRVTEIREDGYSGRRKAVCERVDNGKRLDKLRSASALRELSPSEWAVNALHSTRYLDEFLRCQSSADMLAMRLFPNSKEITESFGAYEAVRRYLWERGYSPGDERVLCVVVGDGVTPRTGATFAFRTRWHVDSVDPRMRPKDYGMIARLRVCRQRIEEYEPSPAEHTDRAIVVAVHSHAPLRVAVDKLKALGMSVATVAIPCCVPQTLDSVPDIEYEDRGIMSEKRTVRVWVDE